MLDSPRPDYLDDIPPPRAATIAQCREQALAWLARHDYQLIMPPLADYLETLTGGDEDLSLQTFKITDTLSGHTLGIRADQTPQIARFDAGRAGCAPQRRYCYCGTTLRARPQQLWQGRESLQLGAELFGAPAGSGDWEIASVALGALRAMGVEEVCVDLGHAGLFAEIAAELPAAARQTLTGLIAQRDAAAVDAFCRALPAIPPQTAARLAALTQIAGGSEALAEAKKLLPSAPLQTLEYVQQQLAAEQYDVGISLSGLGSYGYHSGVVFTIYARDRQIACGGRYRQPGADGGAGFSIDLHMVGDLVAPIEAAGAVNVPLVLQDDSWRQAVAQLRAARRPLRFVYGDDGALPALRQQGGEWVVREK